LYLENNEFDVEKMEKHIFNFLKSNNSYINKINKFDKKIFEVAFQNIIARVNGDDIYAEDVISIN
jgi:phage tail tube protein FII